MENIIDVIIRLMNSACLKKIELATLVEIDNEVDEDGDEYPVTANQIYIENDEVYLKDNEYSNQVWKLTDLSTDIQKDALFSVKYTLGL